MKLSSFYAKHTECSKLKITSNVKKNCYAEYLMLDVSSVTLK